MAKPTDKITVTLTRSEWNLLLAKLTHSDKDIRHGADIKFCSSVGLS